MSNHKTHKLTSLLLAIALLIAPLATLQAAVLSVVDCPDMTMSEHDAHGSASVAGDRTSGATDGMNHDMMTHGSMDSADQVPCTSMDSDCHVSAHSSAVISNYNASFPEMLSSFEPTPDQSFSAVILPTEIKPPISL